MRFALSLLSFRPGRIGGAETYLRQLVAHLPEVVTGDELSVVLDRDGAASLETPGFVRVVVEQGNTATVLQRSAEALTLYRARRIERLFAELAPDAALFPQQSIFPKNVRCPAVLTVVDVQHLLLPRNVSLPDRAFRAGAYRRSLRRADRIIAISEFTKGTVVDRCRVPEGKVVVVPFGLASRPHAPVEPWNRRRRPYLHYPAATYPHKNHLTLLGSLAELKRRGELGFELVLTGQRTAHWRRVARAIVELGLEADVVHLGFLSVPELYRVFAGAHTVVLPTLFEGFGLPVLEGVGYGKRVITSRLAVFDEVGVPRRNQIDFSDPDQLLAALRLEEPTVLEKKAWTWTEMAAATLDVLRDVARQATR